MTSSRIDQKVLLAQCARKASLVQFLPFHSILFGTFLFNTFNGSLFHKYVPFKNFKCLIQHFVEGPNNCVHHWVEHSIDHGLIIFFFAKPSILAGKQKVRSEYKQHTSGFWVLDFTQQEGKGIGRPLTIPVGGARGQRPRQWIGLEKEKGK